MMVEVLLLPLSSSMYNGEFNNDCGHGSGGNPATATVVVVVVVVAMEDNYWQKRPVKRASTVH